MEPILVFLVSFVIGMIIFKIVDRPHKALEAKKNKELEYSAMIHRTQELEKSELGEVKTECECAVCKKPPALIPPGTEVPGWAKSYVREPEQLLDDADKMMNRWREEDKRIKAEVDRLHKKYGTGKYRSGWTASALELSQPKTKYCVKCNINFTDATNPKEYLCYECRPNRIELGVAPGPKLAEHHEQNLPAQVRDCPNCETYEIWGKYEHPERIETVACVKHSKVKY